MFCTILQIPFSIGKHSISFHILLPPTNRHTRPHMVNLKRPINANSVFACVCAYGLQSVARFCLHFAFFFIERIGNPPDSVSVSYCFFSSSPVLFAFPIKTVQRLRTRNANTAARLCQTGCNIVSNASRSLIDSPTAAIKQAPPRQTSLNHFNLLPSVTVFERLFLFIGIKMINNRSGNNSGADDWRGLAPAHAPVFFHAPFPIGSYFNQTHRYRSWMWL